MSFVTEEDLRRDQRYKNAVHLFNQHEWYSAHDAFEELWHESQGGMRMLLQGIIQISVAEYHLDNGNMRGSILLMAEGLNHLLSSDSFDPGFDLTCLETIVRQRLSALQSGQCPTHLPLPVLE
jgi:hypothetical protein